MNSKGSEYLLGHTEGELQRLIRQGQFYADITQQFLKDAGIREGMRVVDVGCGSGDVSFLLAKLVGASGHVLAFDKSSDAIVFAQARAEQGNVENIEFINESIDSFSVPTGTDAVVGRFVLMYLPDPVAALRRLSQPLRPGAIVAFQEMDFSRPVMSMPRSLLYEQCIEWTTKTLGTTSELAMGLSLFQTFSKVGLANPQVRMVARVEGGSDSPAYDYIAQTTRSLLPRMEQLGIASAAQVQIETLAERLREEIVSGGGVIVMRPIFSAWAHR